jgi:hypothetical protein
LSEKQSADAILDTSLTTFQTFAFANATCTAYTKVAWAVPGEKAAAVTLQHFLGGGLYTLNAVNPYRSLKAPGLFNP